MSCAAAVLPNSAVEMVRWESCAKRLTNLDGQQTQVIEGSSRSGQPTLGGGACRKDVAGKHAAREAGEWSSLIQLKHPLKQERVDAVGEENLLLGWSPIVVKEEGALLPAECLVEGFPRLNSQGLDQFVVFD